MKNERRLIYSYLENEQRGQKIHELIAPYIIASDNVLDANCGVCPVSRYIQCKDVLAFDVDEDMVRESHNYLPSVINCSDEEFTNTQNRYTDKYYDVVMLLGITGGGVKEIESDYEFNFLRNRIKNFAPRVIVLEASLMYESAKPIVAALSCFKEYDVKREVITIETDKEILKERVVFIFTKKDKRNYAEKYRDYSESLQKGHTLKTDCWNEVRYEYAIRADVYLEQDETIFNEAKEKGFNVVQGDIREMPFKDKEFDTIVDMSTIDHVLEFRRVLSEYNRTLKAKGILLLVTWLGVKPSAEVEYSEMKSWHCYFPPKEFQTELKKYFEIVEIKEFEEFHTEFSQLKFFHCIKK